MASCKDCIHSEICASPLKVVRGIYGAVMSISGREVNRIEKALSEISITIGQICCDGCDHFQDRSRFVELPCKVGDTVYLLHNVYNNILAYSVSKILINSGEPIIEIVEAERRIHTLYLSPARELNKSLFLTKEQAEQALKEREAT